MHCKSLWIKASDKCKCKLLVLPNQEAYTNQGGHFYTLVYLRLKIQFLNLTLKKEIRTCMIHIMCMNLFLFLNFFVVSKVGSKVSYMLIFFYIFFKLFSCYIILLLMLKKVLQLNIFLEYIFRIFD